MTIVRFYRKPGVSPAVCDKILRTIRTNASSDGVQVVGLESEVCIYVELSKNKGV